MRLDRNSMGSNVKASGKWAGKASRKRRVLTVILIGLSVALLIGVWWGIREHRLAEAAEQLWHMLKQNDEDATINLVKNFPGLAHARIHEYATYEPWGDYFKSILRGRISLRRSRISWGGRGYDEATFLYIACDEGRTRLAKALIAAGADVNAKDSDGDTPLHAARSADLGKLLIAAGADVHRRNNRGDTPLAYAVAPVAELLLAAGADVNASNNEGRAPLHWAAGGGRVEVMNLLIAHGATVNAADNGGDTPLHAASCDLVFPWGPSYQDVGSSAATRVLIAAGAQLNVQDEFGITPLHLFAWREDAPDALLGLELMIKAGANLNLREDSGMTPLGRAAMHGCPNMMKLLVAAGADVNLPDEGGRTPLMHALTKDCMTDLVKLLLTAGADVKVQDTYGDTALHWAAYEGDVEVTQLLLAHGADVDARNNDGKTPLHDAVLKGNSDVIEALISAGADVNACTKDGQTALDTASRYVWSVPDLLRKNGGKTGAELRDHDEAATNHEEQ